MRLVNSISKGKRRVYDIEVDEVHNFYANGLNVHNCATNGGVSVIKDDGTVVDITGHPEVVIHWVEFSKDSKYIHSQGSYASQISKFLIPSADTTIASAEYTFKNTYYQGVAVTPAILGGISPNEEVIGIEEHFYSPLGLTVLKENTTDYTKGSVAYLTSTYNSGYMTGDIKGAWLSDTDTTNATTTNLITNGDFSSSTGWTIQTGWSIASGVATCDGTGGAYLYQISDMPVNTQVTVSVDITSYTSGSVRLGSTGVAYSAVSGVGTHKATFKTRTSGASGVELYSNSFIGSIDNVTVTLADADRSVNNNGLQVNGTITKTAVATGADLVAYSGFSSSNYLEQPYNSDLDFGTGDFSVMGWYNVSASGILVERGNRGVSNTPGFYLWSNGSNTLRFETSANNFVTTFRLDGTLVENVWQYVTALRRSGVMYLYINGVLQGTLASTVNLTNTTAITAFGVASDGSVVLSGSLALWRISATAPTAAQILEIYNAERPMFTENANVTLHGTSDAVTALSFDDSNEELVVATSGGLSVFKGLIRVDEEDGNFTEVSQQGGMRITEKA